MVDLDGACVTCQACVIRYRFGAGNIMPPVLCQLLLCAAFFASGCCAILWACLSSCILASSAWPYVSNSFNILMQPAIFASAGLVANSVASVHLWYGSHPCLLLQSHRCDALSHRCDALCRSSHRHPGLLGCRCLSFSRCNRSSRCYSCSCPQVLVL